MQLVVGVHFPVNKVYYIFQYLAMKTYETLGREVFWFRWTIKGWNWVWNTYDKAGNRGMERRREERRVLFRLELHLKLGYSKHVLGSWKSLVLLHNGNLCMEQFTYIIVVVLKATLTGRYNTQQGTEFEGRNYNLFLSRICLTSHSNSHCLMGAGSPVQGDESHIRRVWKTASFIAGCPWKDSVSVTIPQTELPENQWNTQYFKSLPLEKPSLASHKVFLLKLIRCRYSFSIRGHFCLR